MMPPNFQTYATKLRDAIDKGASTLRGPLDLSCLCPHLAGSEVQELWKQSAEDTVGGIPFISPPIAVRGAEHVFRLRSGGPGNLRRLFYHYANRRKESYVAGIGDDGPAREHIRVGSDREPLFDYRERVANYAEVEWGSRLAWDSSRQTVEFRIVEPDHRTTVGGFRKICSVMAGLDQKLISDDYDPERPDTNHPFVETMERAIIGLSSNLAGMAEWLGGAQATLAINCAYCGGGVGLRACHFCGAAVENPVTQCRVDWKYPLPQLVAVAVPDYHRFRIDPLQAIKRHYNQWALTNYNPPIVEAKTREHRVVELREGKNEV